MTTRQFTSFEVRNEDISLRFTCNNYGKHLRQALRTLIDRQDPQDLEKVECTYATDDENVEFWFDGEKVEGTSYKDMAVFFENTDYPVRAKTLHGGVIIKGLDLARYACNSLSAEDDGGYLYGNLNFHNQVGRTDITVRYTRDGMTRQMGFRTEVLSYKMDYRTDLKTIIADIEREYSMLSYSFLKQTYLSYAQTGGQSTDLIWWQIFHQCYDDIVKATETIINSPKRRLKSQVRYERAERLRAVGHELEQEYSMHQEDPNHLYRNEDLILSKDTVENRFMKFAIREIQRRFEVVREHIKTALRIEDRQISTDLDEMDDRLGRLARHPFFRQIGQFKGFSQDSLVMKRGRGYSTIYRRWLELQCGYELEDGIRRLEVKDVSELYEIWCFIKVKNIVQDILGGQVTARTSGKELTTGFIRQLVYGQQSDVKFEKDGIELATVSYNAEVEEDDATIGSAIEDTATFTTVQRPDIVLRLSKNSDDDIVYTYLFDAKYRLSDQRIKGNDVPPVDAINQMHRYRDAIYYNALDNGIKREIVGGYVLYPGNLTAEEVRASYYHDSHVKIGIGAFPLKPGATIINDDGNLILDPDSSEKVLYDQIAAWLNDGSRRQNLLEKSVPQKGLNYTDEDVVEGCYFLSTIDAKVNEGIDDLREGKGKSFVTGYTALTAGINMQKVRYLAIVSNHTVAGYYHIESMKVVDKQSMLDSIRKDAIETNDRQALKYKGYGIPYRMEFALGAYKRLRQPFVYGLSDAHAGVSMKRKDFREYCNGLKVSGRTKDIKKLGRSL